MADQPLPNRVEGDTPDTGVKLEDGWTEGQFEALICLHMLKPGDVLTEDQCWAIEHTRQQADAVENSAIDAFDEGRKYGILSIAGKSDALMFEEVERLKGKLAVEGALGRFYHRSCKAEFVRGAAACREMMARFVEQGGDPVTANSIRLNWSPSWGDDPAANAPPRPDGVGRDPRPHTDG